MLSLSLSLSLSHTHTYTHTGGGWRWMHADATRAGGDVCVCVCTFAARGRTQSGPAEAGNALTHRAANTREKKVRVAAAWRPGPSEAAQILWLFFLSDARGALPQFLVFSFPLPHMPADYGAFSPLLLTDAPHTHTHTHTHHLAPWRSSGPRRQRIY